MPDWEQIPAREVNRAVSWQPSKSSNLHFNKLIIISEQIIYKIEYIFSIYSPDTYQSILRCYGKSQIPV